MRGVSYVANNQKHAPTCCGNAHLLEMYGATVRGRVQKCSNEVQDFFHLFWMLGRKLTKEEMEKWATLSWAIWNARNKIFFEKIQTHPKVIMEGALATLENYQRLFATQEVA